MYSVIMRIVSIFGLFVIGSLFSWWVMIVGIVIASFFFDYFFEVIIIGIIYDFFFYTPEIAWYLTFLHTLIIMSVVIIMSGIQKIIRKPILTL